MSGKVQAKAVINVVLEVTLDDMPDSTLPEIRAEARDSATRFLQRELGAVSRIKMVGEPTVLSLSVEL